MATPATAEEMGTPGNTDLDILVNHYYMTYYLTSIVSRHMQNSGHFEKKKLMFAVCTSKVQRAIYNWIFPGLTKKSEQYLHP